MKRKLLFDKNSKCKGILIALILSVFTLSNAIAQNRQITGKVTASDDNSNVPGVSVL